MTVYLEDFREVVTRLKSDHDKIEKYSDDMYKLDSSLASFVTENTLTDTYYFQTQFVLDIFLGKELREWVDWFLYEMPCFAKEGESNCSIDGVEYTVTDIESFMHMVEHGLKLPKKVIV